MFDRDQLVDMVAEILLENLRGSYVSQNVAFMYEKAEAVVRIVEAVIRTDEREQLTDLHEALMRDQREKIAKAIMAESAGPSDDWYHILAFAARIARDGGEQ